MINLTYDYYLLAHQHNEYPEWVKSERYFYCDNFIKFLSFFRKK
ncbi:MAG: hypothetical protein ACLUVC_13155 [Longibaculum sp.]